MIRLDIKSMAVNLISFEELTPEVKEVLAERMVEAALSMINDSFTNDVFGEELDFLIYTLENEYGLLNPDAAIKEYAKVIKVNTNKLGWDDRLVLRCKFTKIPKTLNLCLITMDLDKTISLINDNRIKDEFKEKKPVIQELVSVTPELEEINRLLNTMDKENVAKENLLSNRTRGNNKRVVGRGR